MMDTVFKYVSEVAPDGHIPVPEEIRQRLATVAPHTLIQITIRVLQPTVEQEQAAWEAFLSMGQDASSGQFPDASLHHNRYLYRKTR
jgi:hypothetical protein